MFFQLQTAPLPTATRILFWSGTEHFRLYILIKVYILFEKTCIRPWKRLPFKKKIFTMFGNKLPHNFFSKSKYLYMHFFLIFFFCSQRSFALLL